MVGNNLYAYVGNNPINFIDQLGLDPISTLEGALAGVCHNRKCVSAGDENKCIADAKRISDALGNFVSHYSNPANGSGTGTGDQPVNGYWCWDWAVGLTGAIEALVKHRSLSVIECS